MIKIADLNVQRKANNQSAITAPVNSRQADANSVLQQAQSIKQMQQNVMDDRQKLLDQHNAGTITTEEYNRQNSFLTSQARNIAGSTAQVDPAALDAASSQAQERSAAYGANAPLAGSTGNTKIGEPTTALNNNPSVAATAERKAKREQEIAGLKGFTTVTKYDANGNPYQATVEDPAKTQQLQQDARAAGTAQDTADANYAAGLNETQNQGQNPGTSGATTNTTPKAPATSNDLSQTITDAEQAFYAGLSPEDAQKAQGLMGGIFDLYKTQAGSLDANTASGAKMLADIQDRTNAYVQNRQGQMDYMQGIWQQQYGKQLNNQLDAAQNKHDSDMALADQEKEHEQILLNRAIRDQALVNEEEKRRLLLGNGISGGWRSSMATTSVIRAINLNENKLSDLREDQVYNSKVWTNKMTDIENTYHADFTTAYDTYDTNLLGLQDKIMTQAADLDKTVFSNDIEQRKAVQGLSDSWYEGVTHITEGLTKDLVQYRTDMDKNAHDAKIDLQNQQNKILDDERAFASLYGDTNPQGWADIQNRKATLGLATSPNVPTLAQQDKMQKQVIANMATSMINNKNNTVQGTNYGLLGVNSVSSTKYATDDVTRNLQTLDSMLANGNIAGAKQQILTFTRQGMGQAQQEQVTSQDSLINEIGYMKSEMSNYSPTYGAFWKSLIESGKPIANMKQDETYKSFVAHVQRVLGEERHRLFGSALTGNENTQADSYLFNPATDSAAVLQGKLTSLEDIARRSRATRFDEILGSGAYNTLTGENVQSGAPNTYQTPATQLPSEEQQFQNALKLWNTDPPQSSTFNSPQSGGGNSSDVGTASYSQNSPFASYISGNGLRVTQQYNGTFDQTHAKEINGTNQVFTDGRTNHASYNIAPPTPGQRNVPAPVYSPGTVVSVKKSDKGYGNEVRIKDAQGNTWIYGHLDNIAVKPGDVLQKGIPVGTMGDTGWATGITLHLEARDKNNKPFDFAIS